MRAPMPDRFDHLCRSDSGLHFVRERKGGVMRVLTESEMADFNDPPPCPDCAEQFGCEHRNCAGEPMMAESEVPDEWRALALAHGLSREDLGRLAALQLADGEYRAPGGDMRAQELALLLNGAEE
jgi:hypothetical protein